MQNPLMTSSAASSCAKLEDALRRYMAAGIALTDEVRRFMEATFGDASAATLQALLSDESSAERDSLLDLIFFPDGPLQIAMEPILEGHPLEESDVALLADWFKAEPPCARLQIPGRDETLPALMPAFAVEAFLGRMNIAWQPAEALVATLAHLDARPLSPTGKGRDGRMRLRVALRNAALRQTPVQLRFLVDFFEHLPTTDPGFVDKLAFMLVFMKEHEDSANIYAALMARKRFLFRNLMIDRRSAELAARNNMETLIMTGVRRPHFDCDAAQQALALIDDIATAVFGRTEAMDGAPRQVALGDGAASLDPDELIRRLS